MTLSAIFVGLAILGWTCRWRLLHEVLLQIDKAKPSAHAMAEVDPLLCETLLHDPSSKRRVRAANLLLCADESDGQARGEVVWEALLQALRDRDPKVADAAWFSLVGAASQSREPGLDAWLAELSGMRCVQVLADVKSPAVRSELIETLGRLQAKSYKEVARWALRSLTDTKTLNRIFQELYTLRGNAQGEWLGIGWTVQTECLIAGLENPNPDFRDQCRKLLLFHVQNHAMAEELVDWIRTTRDVPTLEVIVGTLQESPSGAWKAALKRRLAEETELGTAAGISMVLPGMVGKEREREFLEAGLRNSDPKIRDYFEGLLRALPEDDDAPAEPDDGH